MREIKAFILLLTGSAKAFGVAAVIVSAIGCNKHDGMMDNGNYATNGETIFRTGKNKQGQIMQNIAKSQMKMPHSCQSCHGADGKGMMGGGMMNGGMMCGGMPAAPSIRYIDLSNPQLHAIPYNDALIIRFLDHELKSDSTAAQTGVAWKMSMQDKLDLIAFLKTL